MANLQVDRERYATDPEFRERKRRQSRRQQAPVAARRERLLEKQGRRCAICGTDDPGKRGWALDHNHACCDTRTHLSCGQCDRGVLCTSCNVRLSPLEAGEWTEKAMHYLETH